MTRSLPSDWYPGTVPDNIHVDATAYFGSSYAFTKFRSRLAVGLAIGRGASLCDGAILDVGEAGCVTIGEFALVTSALIICDREVSIGPYAMVSWNAVIMDSYRFLPRVISDSAMSPPFTGAPSTAPHERTDRCRPVHVCRNAWIGFDACILPGVTIGEGAIVGARSVVISDVPDYAIVGGNPARIIRSVPAETSPRESHRRSPGAEQRTLQ